MLMKSAEFTLYASVAKNKPDFSGALVSDVHASVDLIGQSTEPAREMYGRFLDRLRNQYSADKIQGTLRIGRAR